MQGYRTLILAGVQFVIGILTMFGVTVPDGSEEILVDNAMLIIGGVIAVLAIKDWAMRLVTKTPPGEKQ